MLTVRQCPLTSAEVLSAEKKRVVVDSPERAELVQIVTLECAWTMRHLRSAHARPALLCSLFQCSADRPEFRNDRESHHVTTAGRVPAGRLLGRLTPGELAVGSS